MAIVEPHRLVLAYCSSSPREIIVFLFSSVIIDPHEWHFSFTIVSPNFVLCRTRLVAVATQKFISDIASDSLQYENPQSHYFVYSPQCNSFVGVSIITHSNCSIFFA